MKKLILATFALVSLLTTVHAVAYDTLQVERITGWSATVFADAVNQTEMDGTVDVIRVTSTVNNAFRFTTPVQANVNEFFYVAGANTTNRVGRFVGKFIYSSQGNRYITSEKSQVAYGDIGVRFGFFNSGGVVNATMPYYYRGDAFRVAKIYFDTKDRWGVQYAGGNNITRVNMHIYESIINQSNPGVINWGFWNATYDVGNQTFRAGAAQEIVTENLTAYQVAAPYYLQRNLGLGFVSPHGSILDAVAENGFTIRYLRDGPNFSQVNSNALANKAVNLTQVVKPRVQAAQPFIPKSSNAKPDFVSGLVGWVKNLFGD